MSAVVDANVLVAARLRRDSHHERGLSLARAFDQRRLPRAAVPSSVLEEIINLVHARTSHERATETLDAVVESVGFEIEHVHRVDLDAARPLFRRYDGLSLTDAVIVAWMRRNERDYLYSFDDDFDAVEGITRLDTPHDPFGFRD